MEKAEKFQANETKEEFQANNRKLNLMLHGGGGLLQSVSCNNYDAKLITHNQPLLSDFIDHQNHTFNILGSCDGLLLVVVTTSSGDNAIYIWNPITGEYKLLPQLKSKLKTNVVCGFGRDLTTDNNNYKVLYLESVLGDSELKTMEFKVNMYSTYTNSWKTILPNIPFWHSGGNPVGMILAYNNLHVLAEIDTTEDDPFVDQDAIISFDLKDDKFREVPLLDAPGTLVTLCNLNGDLCALTNGHHINVYDIWRMENFGVKEQECWTKLFSSIDSHVVMDQPVVFLSPLHLLDDGKILLSAHYRYPNETNPFVICYCNKENKASFLVQGNAPFWSIPVVYEESPISPNAASTVEELPGQLKRRRIMERYNGRHTCPTSV